MDIKEVERGDTTKFNILNHSYCQPHDAVVLE